MAEGLVNPNLTLEKTGISGVGTVYYNLLEPELVAQAVQRGEAVLGQGGTVLAETGKHTGRSPNDKFVVRDANSEDTIWWDNNKPMSPEHFELLQDDMMAHMQGRDYFVQDLFGGADPAYRFNVRLVTELAWHALFIRHMLRRPEQSELETFLAEFTIVNCPSFNADPERHGCRSETVIAINLTRKMILIGGTSYAGENKKSVFTLLNYLLPEKGVMPMHCSANHAINDSDDTAIFFGLSGTGKTTLSADSSRVLLGDDEHGWTDTGTFNFEGGCYAKTINLSADAEPEIYATTSMFGTVIENMVFDPYTKELDFADVSKTNNTRCAYPLHYIANASETGMGGTPKNVIMLTCDAFGVMPPVAQLSPEQAMYHFLSGFTAKMAGMEKGQSETLPTFSTCFGAPFMPRRPEVYGNLLRKKIAETGAKCWLVNTGWTGGGQGKGGSRMPIRATRAILNAILNGGILEREYRPDPNFGFSVPISVKGVPKILLNPRLGWEDRDAYDAQAEKLVGMFRGNFDQYLPHVEDDVKAAAI